MREAIYDAPTDSSLVASLINWVLPFSQRYMFNVHPEKYLQLSQSGFQNLRCLQIVVVEKLFYRNVIRSSHIASKKQFECSCLLEGNILYATQESDSHSIFMEISRLLSSGTPDLHLANFLHMITTMAESGSNEEQTEFFILNSQKMPKLPESESVWSLANVPLSTDSETGVMSSSRTIDEKNPEKIKKRPGISPSWPPTDWKTAPGFHRSSVCISKGKADSGIQSENNTVGESVMKTWALTATGMTCVENMDNYPESAAVVLGSQGVDHVPGTIMEAFDSPHAMTEPHKLSNSSSDVTERDQLHTATNGNSDIMIETGRLGEYFAFKYFLEKFGEPFVKWVNETNETGLPYDLVVGDDEYIEIKTTRSSTKDWFHITAREWQFAVEKGESFSIAHVFLSPNNTGVVTVYKNPFKLYRLGNYGKLPAELGNLKYLEELRLDRNKLQGLVPANTGSDFTSAVRGMYASGASATGFCRTSQLKVADFSFNFLIGSIPKCLGYLPKSSFQGNCLQHKDPKQRSAALCGSTSPPTSHASTLSNKHQPVEEPRHQTSSKPTWLLALEVVTGVMVGSLFIVGLVTGLQRLKNKSSIIPWKKSGSEKDHMTIYVDTGMLKDVVRYSRQELEVACEDFSNIIGSSPDSIVYKGTMKGGPEIAVISLCVKEEHWTAYLELYFQKEVAELARINHENAGKLLGYCRESSPFTRMLVFEYASNGTLYEHLHYGEGCQLSWTRRMKIVIGIAKGLTYFHSELDPPFTISELNSNSVYLTEDFSPKLVDFESWKSIISRSEKNSGAISSEGAICVLPNTLESRHLDVQGNIYAFGVLLLEIISGRPPYCKDKGCLVDWAKEFLEMPEVLSYVVDPELKHFKQEDLKVICEVINHCIHPTTSRRTSIKDLCAILESNIDTSITAELKASSLAWAELALSS